MTLVYAAALALLAAGALLWAANMAQAYAFGVAVGLLLPAAWKKWRIG